MRYFQTYVLRAMVHANYAKPAKAIAPDAHSGTFCMSLLTCVLRTALSTTTMILSLPLTTIIALSAPLAAWLALDHL